MASTFATLCADAVSLLQHEILFIAILVVCLLRGKLQNGISSWLCPGNVEVKQSKVNQSSLRQKHVGEFDSNSGGISHAPRLPVKSRQRSFIPESDAGSSPSRRRAPSTSSQGISDRESAGTTASFESDASTPSWPSTPSWRPSRSKEVVASRKSTVAAGNEKHGHEVALARQAAKMIQAEARRDKGRPLEMHEDAIAAGTSFSWLPTPEAHRLYLSLGLAALRSEAGDAPLTLLRDIKQQKIPIPASLLALIVKRLTARKHYRRCMETFDIACPMDTGLQVDDKEFWSSLLVSATETGSHVHCEHFWTSLRMAGTATTQDYHCMLRVAAAKKDGDATMRLVKAMRTDGLTATALTCGVAISTCVSTRQTAAAVEILDMLEMDEKTFSDACLHTQVMQAQLLDGDINGVFQLWLRMCVCGCEPTRSSYEVLKRACKQSGGAARTASAVQRAVAGAARARNDSQCAQLVLDLICAGQIDIAMVAYEALCHHQGSEKAAGLLPDLLSAQCQAGKPDDCLHLMESMFESGQVPDHTLFAEVFAMCGDNLDTQDSHPALWATLNFQEASVDELMSVLASLYARCHMFCDATRLLERMPTELGRIPAVDRKSVV